MRDFKGNLIFWEITDLSIEKEELEREGFEGYVPRNDYKSAIIKALKIYTKGNEKLYRRFNDSGRTVSFAVFVQEVNQQGIELNKEITLTISKKTGRLTSESEIPEKIRTEYNREKDRINSNQFRAMVLRFIRRNAYAISMRSGGGVYYLDEKYNHVHKKLSELFKKYPKKMKLFTIPVYNDDGTLTALEKATSDECFQDLQQIVKEISAQTKKGIITERLLAGRQKDCEELLQKVKAHESSLQDKAKTIRAKVAQLEKHLKDTFVSAEAIALDPEDFMAELEAF
jgi:hypothetical protein